MLDFNEAIRADPNNAAAYRSRGTAHEFNGDIEKSEADFAKAQELLK